MIAPVHYNDLWEIPSFLLQFVKESPYYSQFSTDVNHTHNHLVALERNQMLLGAKYTYEGSIVGVMLGVMSRPWFTPESMAMEMILYVRPEFRGAKVARSLILEFERQAVYHGAAHIITGSSAGINDAGVGLLYKRMGYTETPTGYKKGLK